MQRVIWTRPLHVHSATWCHQIKAETSYFQYSNVQGVLENQGTKALIQAGESFLRDDCRVAIESSIVARNNR